MRRPALILFSALVGITMAVVILEVGFRIHGALTFRSIDSIDTGHREPLVQPGEETPLQEIIQISGNRRMVYDLVPSSTYRFIDVEVMTNDLGFRDREYPENKPADTKRIVGLGDSVMFAYGVDVEDSYLARVEEDLNRDGTIRYEIINTAVPGYSTVMQVEALKEKIDISQVDLIVINVVGNDFDLPRFIVEKPDYLSPGRLFMIEYFCKYRGFRFAWAPLDETDLWWEGDPEKVPAEYRDIVGDASWKDAMAELAGFRDRWGFEVIVLWDNPLADPPAIVPRVSQDLGFTYVEVEPDENEFRDSQPGSGWMLTETDRFHPSAAGHRVIADTLREAIVRMDLATPGRD